MFTLYFKCFRGFSSHLNSTSNMPKARPDIAVMRQDRLNKKNLKTNSNPSGSISICVLGNGSREGPTSLLLRAEHQQMMFNCGESTQRICFANGVKITKLEHIFVTQPRWRNIGGLLGMSLTLQGMGVPTLNVHSTIKFSEFFRTTSGFAVSNLIRFEDSTPDDHDAYSNVDLTVSYVNIFPKNSSSSGDVKKLKTLNPTVLCYLCRLRDNPGTLDFKKCMAKNVPRGPLLAKLKDGQDVTLDDGSIVKADDVRGPNQPGCYFLVADCPSLNYIESLASHSQLNAFYDPSNDLLSHIFHLAPHDVTQTKEYQQWIEMFPPSVTHIMINENNEGSPITGVGVLQEKLRLVDTDIFPALNLCSNYMDVQEDSNMVKPLPLATIPLRPRISRTGEKQPSYVTTTVPTFLPGGYRGVIDSLDGVEEAIKEYQEKKKSLPDSPVYPVITFFGTASAIPGKDRNTSSIWIDLSENDAIVFDCAEGTFAQMARMFGENLASQLKKLHCIFISHLHADHHLGLIEIITRRALVTDKPLTLIVPRAVAEWIVNYDETFESLGNSYSIRLNDEFVYESPEITLLSNRLGLEKLQTCRVRHCRDSFGVSIKSRDNFKIVYSGDAMPSNNLVTLGKAADVLIHEATMEDGLERDAQDKCHSTISQAIQVGKDMQAKNVILTHFSQRYAKFPILRREVLDRSTNVSCAFDNMRIRRCDLPKLPLMIPAMQAMFKEYEDQTLMKSHKKKLKEKLAEEILNSEQISG